jgi:hypothetical protein
MSATIDQQFVEFIVKSIVGKPDAVSINRTIDEKGVLLELTVDPEDLGRVIGKHGATAQSIRTLLRALGTKSDARYNLKIIDNTPEGGRPPRRDDRPPRSEEPSASSDDSSTGTSMPADDSSSAAPVNEEDTNATPAAEPVEDVALETPKTEEGTSDSVSRTRKELEDLDDLDV